MVAWPRASAPPRRSPRRKDGPQEVNDGIDRREAWLPCRRRAAPDRCRPGRPPRRPGPQARRGRPPHPGRAAAGPGAAASLMTIPHPPTCAAPGSRDLGPGSPPRPATVVSVTQRAELPNRPRPPGRSGGLAEFGGSPPRAGGGRPGRATYRGHVVVGFDPAQGAGDARCHLSERPGRPPDRATDTSGRRSFRRDNPHGPTLLLVTRYTT